MITSSRTKRSCVLGDTYVVAPDTGRSGRLSAMGSVALSDAVTACFNAKYNYAFWRPYTAIHHADPTINPETVPDPNWIPPP